MNALILVLVAVVPASPDTGGVILPDSGWFAARSQMVLAAGVQDVTGPSDVWSERIGAQLPPTDRERWWIVVYADFLRDPESQQLSRDFTDHKGLRELAEWSKFWSIDVNSSPVAEARHVAALGKDFASKLPAVLVVANPDDPDFGRKSKEGWKYAYVGQGYGGDAVKLAQDIYEGIQRQYKDRGVANCPGPLCPVRPKTPPKQPDNEPDGRPWNPAPPPPRPGPDNEPQTPPSTPWDGWKPSISRWDVYLVIGILVLLYVAKQKGWLKTIVTNKTTKKLFLAGAVSLSCCQVLAADAVLQPVLEPVGGEVMERYYPDQPPTREQCEGLFRLFDKVAELIDHLIWAVKTVVWTVFCLGSLNVFLNCLILFRLRGRKAP